MTEVNFIFDIDQPVLTPFGEKGIVSMLGFDESGRVYYVKTSKHSEWYKEKQLSAC